MLRWLFSGIGRVSGFSIHEPPHTGSTKLERAESLVFVGDRFSWRAAFFGPLYFLMRGEWLSLAAYAAAVLVLAAILTLAGAETDWIVWIFILLNVVAGFEASDLKRWSLHRAGWEEIATVSGRDREEAERRFFDAWLPTLPAETPGRGTTVRAGPWSSPANDTTSRIEAAVQRLATRLRSRFAVKP